MQPLQPLFILLAVLLALSACTTTAPRKPPPVDTALSESARQLAERGDFAGAARLYLDEAQSASDRSAAELRLGAAQYLAQGERWDQLDGVLATIDDSRLAPERRSQFVLLQAELALARDDPNRALGLLQQIRDPAAMPDRGKRYHRVGAHAYQRAGNPLEAARQFIALDALITDPEERKANQVAIWDELSVLSDQSLQQLRTSPPPDVLSGWMELVLLTRRSGGNRQAWTRDLEDWRYRYPGHPAEQAMLPAMLDQAQRVGPQPEHIAVLLPFSGRTAQVAAAVRDGILTARYDGAERPEIRFYDSSGGTPVLSVYQQAVDNGAEIIIGPLLKDRILQLAEGGPLTVPVLALNQIDTNADAATTQAPGTTPGDGEPLYQFGLAPEDEARQAARRMLADGHLQIVALAPANAWGQRVLAAFRAGYTELGGILVDSVEYDPSSADFGEPIKKLLNLGASRARHRAVERLFGKKLEFQPRRRQDASAVFLLAFPRQARLIQPQLRFHGAGDLPVYSTSHVFTGTVNATTDKDMDGIRFCDIPWLLDADGNWGATRSEVDRLWPKRSARYPRLFALGIDAYRVLPWLKVLQGPGPGSFSGATGELDMDAHLHLHRRLKWARFRKGVPVLMEDRPYFAPATETGLPQPAMPQEAAPDTSREGRYEESQGYGQAR